MSGKFTIKRNADGLRINIQSSKIEDLFKNISRENHATIALGGCQFEAWHSDPTEKFIRNISDMFTQQSSTLTRGRSGVKEEELIVPTFRSTAIFQNNSVGINLLLAQGLGVGKEFQIQGMFSIETTRKIGLGFQKAMDYLINEAAKPCTYTFEILERGEKKEESQILEFPTT